MSSDAQTAAAAASATSATPASTSASAATSDSVAQLDSLLEVGELSTAAFESTYARLVKEGAQTGECNYPWVAFRHLLSLRLQDVYQSFVATEFANHHATPTAAGAADAHPLTTADLNKLCVACRQKALANSGSRGGGGDGDNTAATSMADDDSSTAGAATPTAAAEGNLNGTATTTDDSTPSTASTSAASGAVPPTATVSNTSSVPTSLLSPAALHGVECRLSRLDVREANKNYINLMHMIIAFYKPPFTFQRLCELLLSPRQYCKTVSQFLQSLSKLVCGINSETPEDALNSDWLEQKAASLNLPPVDFVSRDIDELSGTGRVFPHSAASAAASAANTHAILTPQAHTLKPKPLEPQQHQQEAVSAQTQDSSAQQHQQADSSTPMETSD